MNDLIQFGGGFSALTILDTVDSDASPILSQFMAHLSKNEDENCIVVCLSNLPDHYLSVLKRMGNQNKIKFVNCLKSQNLHIKDDLDALKNEISRLVVGCKDKSSCVVIDDLTALYHLGHEIDSVVRFMIGVQKLLQENGGDSTFIQLLHADSYYDRTSKTMKKLIDWSVSTSHYILSTNGLSSGYSKDIDGVLTLSRGVKFAEKNNSSSLLFHARTVHYKVMDTEVKLIDRGLSSAVL